MLATRYDLILAIGDDTTDDDMFKAVPVTAVTVKIGTASESARYNLPVQTDTLPFLQRLTDKSVVKAALKKWFERAAIIGYRFFKTDNKPLTLQKNNHGQFELRCNR